MIRPAADTGAPESARHEVYNALIVDQCTTDDATWLLDQIEAEARAAGDAEVRRLRFDVAARLFTAVEAAILNIQHNRYSAAIAGLRVARRLTVEARALAASQPSAAAAQGPGMPDRRALSSAIGATVGDYAGNDIPWPPTQEFSDRVMARLQGLAAIGRYAAAASPDPDPAGAPE